MIRFWIIFSITSVIAVFGQEYDDRSQNQWWSDYASLDEYNDDDLDRHLHIIITKNILPGDAPFPLDERLFYRRPSSSSEEFDFEQFAPISPPPRRKSSTRRIPVSSTPLPTLPPETPRPRASPKPTRRPIFRPAFTRPPPTPPPSLEEEVVDDENEDIIDDIETPRGSAIIDPLQPSVLSDSQNIFVTRGTESPKVNPSPNRLPEVQPRRIEKPIRRPVENVRRQQEFVLSTKRVDEITRRPEPPPLARKSGDNSRRLEAPPVRKPEVVSRNEENVRKPQVFFTGPSENRRNEDLDEHLPRRPPQAILFSSTSFPNLRTSTQTPLVPTTFRPRLDQININPSTQTVNLHPSSLPPNSAVFIPPQSSFTQAPFSPITRQSLDMNEFFSSSSTASFSASNLPQHGGRRTQVLKRRFKPSPPPETEFAEPQSQPQQANEEETFLPRSLPVSNQPAERRRFRISSELNNNNNPVPTALPFEEAPKRKSTDFNNNNPSTVQFEQPPRRKSTEFNNNPSTVQFEQTPRRKSSEFNNPSTVQFEQPPRRKSSEFNNPSTVQFEQPPRRKSTEFNNNNPTTVQFEQPPRRKSSEFNNPSTVQFEQSPRRKSSEFNNPSTVQFEQSPRRKSSEFNNNPTTVQFEATPKRKSTVSTIRRQSRPTTIAEDFSQSTQFPIVTSGRLSEPRRIVTSTARPLLQSSPAPIVKKEFRKKVPPTSSPFIQSSPLPPQQHSQQPTFIRRRPVGTSTLPDIDFRSPSPDVEVRGRIPVTTSIPQLFLSTQPPNLLRHTPDFDISSNTEIISPADLREVARLEHSHASTRFQRDETRRRNVILAAESSGNVEFVQDIDDLYLLSKLSALGDNSVPKPTSPPPNLNSSLYTWSPNCITPGKTFCSYENDYPNDLVTQVILNHQEQMSRLYDVTTNIPTLDSTTSNTSQETTHQKSSQFVCESHAEVVRPGWAKQSNTGSWLVIVNTDQYPQRIRIESCTRQNDACLFISPYYRSSCVQRESTQRMVAIDPQFPHQGPFMALFNMPCGCSCQVGTQGTLQLK